MAARRPIPLFPVQNGKIVDAAASIRTGRPTYVKPHRAQRPTHAEAAAAARGGDLTLLEGRDLVAARHAQRANAGKPYDPRLVDYAIRRGVAPKTIQETAQ